MTGSEVGRLAAEVVEAFSARGWRIATAESCTGGLVAAALTEIPGSSVVLDRGFVTYSNEAKSQMLGVAPDLISQDGAVSHSVALAMAAGALANSPADVAVAVTGIAGPGGGSADKPVGLVHFACARRGGGTRHHEARFGDLGRSAVRQASVETALRLVLDIVGPDTDQERATPPGEGALPAPSTP